MAVSKLGLVSTLLFYLLASYSLFADASALSDLDAMFRNAYSDASARRLSEMRARGPLLVNRFGQIALYRPDVAEPEIFTMDSGAYLTARTVAHSAVALVVELEASGLGPL
ncbi:MAG: hypothetical protein ACRYGP_30060 [Janthinobacterium lividum]